MRKLIGLLAGLGAASIISVPAFAGSPIDAQVKHIDNVSIYKVGTYEDGTYAIWVSWRDDRNNDRVQTSASSLCDIDGVKWIYWDDIGWLLYSDIEESEKISKGFALDCLGHRSVIYEFYFSKISGDKAVVHLTWVDKTKWKSAAAGFCLLEGVDTVINMTNLWKRRDLNYVSEEDWEIYHCEH